MAIYLNNTTIKRGNSGIPIIYEGENLDTVLAEQEALIAEQEAMIINIQTALEGKAANSMSLDVIAAASLPAAVTDGQIVVITDTTPNNIYVDTNEPANPVEGDVWVVVGVSETGIQFDSTFRNGLNAAKQYSDGIWTRLIGYVGVGGNWEGFGMLPEEYQEVEYIESSGTQYIDTGFVPNHNARVVLDAYIEASSSLRSLFGYRGSSSADSFAVWQFASYLRTDYGRSATEMTSFSPPNRLVVDKNKAVTNLNGTEYTNEEQTFTSGGNLALFAMNGAGSVSSFCVGKIYSCRVYDNRTLIRDLVPCYRKSDGVAGLYDVANDVFYSNAGTGTFAKGADVNLSPEQLIDILTGEAE